MLLIIRNTSIKLFTLWALSLPIAASGFVLSPEDLGLGEGAASASVPDYEHEARQLFKGTSLSSSERWLFQVFTQSKAVDLQERMKDAVEGSLSPAERVSLGICSAKSVGLQGPGWDDLAIAEGDALGVRRSACATWFAAEVPIRAVASRWDAIQARLLLSHLSYPMVVAHGLVSSAHKSEFELICHELEVGLRRQRDQCRRDFVRAIGGRDQEGGGALDIYLTPRERMVSLVARLEGLTTTSPARINDVLTIYVHAFERMEDLFERAQISWDGEKALKAMFRGQLDEEISNAWPSLSPESSAAVAEFLQVFDLTL